MDTGTRHCDDGRDAGLPRRSALDEIGIGVRIDDFDLLTDLGAGAFAGVFLARQRSLQRLVAVKISADHGTEPQTLAHLDHATSSGCSTSAESPRAL